jgi:hypothetical protein
VQFRLVQVQLHHRGGDDSVAGVVSEVWMMHEVLFGSRL